jgi:transaldolase
MTQTLFEQLESMSVIVADTGEFNEIKKYKPRDATTNPSLIAMAAQMEEYAELVEGAIQSAVEQAGGGAAQADVIALAIDLLSVEFGLRILEIIPGRVSTEVDARLSYDTEGTVKRALRLIGFYEKAGVSRDRILIKIATTWEGVEAAKILEAQGIHCNLTLLFGLHQAVACGQAGVTLISPFVGRILDWYKKETGKTEIPIEDDPGVKSVAAIFDYYKRHGHDTEIMGASFRSLDEVLALAGCDLLTIAPKYLAALNERTDVLPLGLDLEKAKTADVEAIEMNKDVYDRMHAEDKMAREKLDEGIAGFTKSLEQLETMLAGRL